VQLAALLGIHVTQVSKLENKAVNVKLKTMLKVFEALHTRISISFELEVA
jgi:transcriptional regulator with XRE-family HTH domain